jgi:hypothetical protein
LNGRQKFIQRINSKQFWHFYSLLAEDSNLFFLAEINAISDIEKTPFNSEKILLVFPYFFYPDSSENRQPC